MTAQFKFILFKPRNPDNIGACARAMANFGITELALVNTFESDWAEVVRNWKQEASVSAIDCMEIIENASIYPGIPEAAADCGLLLGTSSLHRIKPDREVISLSGAAAYIAGRGGPKTGVLFGPEKTGLTHDDLSFCSAILNIPTRDRQPSMNLGQAVAVAAYELTGSNRAAPRAARPSAPEASPEEIARMTAALCAELRERGGGAWGTESQARAIRQGLLDARLTKSAMHALRFLLKK